MREQWVLFESVSLGDTRLEVRSLEGHDELNQLFRFVARVARPGVQMSADEAIALLDGAATLTFEEDGRALQRIHGIVAEVSTRASVEADATELRIELVPRAFELTQRRGSEIFVDRSVPQVLAEKLAAIGLVPEVDFLMPLRGSYPVREFIAQYEETDHAFVARLCEQHGLITFFEHHSGRDVLVITDTPATFRPIERPHVPVRQRRAHPAAYDVHTTLRRVPAQAETHDYNYRTPLVALRDRRLTSRPAAHGGWSEYGPHPKTVEETAALARIRTEELGARHHTVAAKTSEASVRAGGTFHLEDAGGHDEHLLIVRTLHRFRGRDGGAEASGWENEVTAIPATVTYRPPRRTPWPRIPGLLNAVVDGAIKGHYAELDTSGRYHLRMMYDRSERTDLGATHPVRMMQPHAGANYGMHFPLRRAASRGARRGGRRRGPVEHDRRRRHRGDAGRGERACSRGGEHDRQRPRQGGGAALRRASGPADGSVGGARERAHGGRGRARAGRRVRRPGSGRVVVPHGLGDGQRDGSPRRTPWR